LLISNFRPGIADINENHRGPAEDHIFKGNAFINTNIVLDLAFVAYLHIWTDEAVLADVKVLADGGAGEDVREMPDFCAFADFVVARIGVVR